MFIDKISMSKILLINFFFIKKYDNSINQKFFKKPHIFNYATIRRLAENISYEKFRYFRRLKTPWST